MMKTALERSVLALCAAAALTHAACAQNSAPPSQTLPQSPAPSQSAPDPQSAPAQENPASGETNPDTAPQKAPQELPVKPEWLIPPNYEVLNVFWDGEYTTGKRDGTWYILDKTGKETARLPYDEAYLESHTATDPMDPEAEKKIMVYSFQEGLAKVEEVYSDGTKATLGYVDTDGNIAIDYSVTEEVRETMIMVVGSQSGTFSDGLTWKVPVGAVEWNPDNFQFIDKTGEVVFSAPAGAIYRTRSFFGGLCAQVLMDGSIRYLDTQGRAAVTLAGSYADCGDMRNGYAWFTTQDGKEGLMDNKGNIVLEPNYAAVGDVSEEGICFFQDAASGLKGLMRPDGFVVVPASYRDLYSPREGLAYASLDGELYGYINPKGEMVVEPQFLGARSSCRGICMVTVGDGKVGAIKNPLA